MPFKPARWIAALLALILSTSTAQAQILSGHWVQLQDQRIDEHRKCNIRIIVLDAHGRPVPRAQVHVAMQRHHFPFGVRLDAASFTGEQPPAHEAPIWNLLNTIAIEDINDQLQLDPPRHPEVMRKADAMVQWAQQHGLAVRWGSVVSTELSRLPAWVSSASDDAVLTSLENHMQHIGQAFGARVTQWDVITGLPDHSYLQQRFGPGLIRRIMSRAQAVSPDTPRHIRFTDTLAGPRLTDMVKALADLRDAQVPVSGLSMEFKLGGNVVYVSLERSMEWIGQLGLPVSIVNLEVGGPDPSAAAVNLETTLRTLYSYPFIQGIWFNGLSREQVIDPSSAFVGEFNQITPSGDLLQKMIGKLWWTDEIIVADALGNARSRVFAGAYRIQALLPDGSQAQIDTYIQPASKKTQLIIVQQLHNASAATGNKP